MKLSLRPLALRPYLIIAVAALLLGVLMPTASAQFQRAGGNPFQPPNATVHYPRNRDYHVRHLRLVFDINGQEQSAHGVVTHYLAPLNDGLKTIVLDAGSNLKIESCKIDNESRPFVHDKDTLTITPAAPLARGKEVAVEVQYTMPGSIRARGANGAGGFHWVDPNPDNPDRKIEFWTQGETDGNHTWVPCYDYPNDKCTSETIVTVPEDWEVIGNGTQGPTTHDSGKRTRTFRWTMKQPHSTYLLSLVGGELDVKKSSWAGVPLYYVVPKGRADLIEGSFGNTPDMLQFFSTILGVKYPWPKYAENAMIDFGGGMENVSATTLGAGSLVDQRSGNYPMSSLNSHELAHQWFGDYVTCAHWGDVWLNESFATFFAALYDEHHEGKDAYDAERDSELRAYLNESRRYKRPLSTHLYSNPDVMFDSHTYPKGGLILHMLRRELGDADFFRGLGHYLRVNAMQPVDAHDLEKAITEETGHDVEPFFDQWIFKPGHPVLETSWSYDEAGKAVVYHVKQTQDTSDGTPIYTMPLTIALLHNAPNAFERQTVTVNQADQEFRLPSATRPDAVLTDPDHDLLKEIKNSPWSDSELPTILRYAPCYLDRRAAALRVAGVRDPGQFGGRGGGSDDSSSTLDDAKVQLLADALHNETSETCGAALIRLLAGTKREALRPLFREQAGASFSKQIGRRAAALTALGNLPRNDDDLKLMRSIALSDTEMYPVVNSATSVLREWDAAGNLDVFKHQIETRSANDQLAARAVNILAAVKTDATAPLLLEATTQTHSYNTRIAAVKALGKVSVASAPVNTTLMGLLKEDDRPRLLEAVAGALKDRKDHDAVPALRSLAIANKNQEVRDAAKEAADSIEGK